MLHYNEDKIISNLMTIIIDFLLLHILFNQDTKIIDTLFIKIVLVSHLIFYYAIYSENVFLLDISHILIFILSLLSIFVKSKSIKLIVLGLLLSIQILWIIKKKCLLFNLPNNLEEIFSKLPIKELVFTLTIILICQIFRPIICFYLKNYCF